jgi:hypothetical protein
MRLNSTEENCGLCEWLKKLEDSEIRKILTRGLWILYLVALFVLGLLVLVGALTKPENGARASLVSLVLLLTPGIFVWHFMDLDAEARRNHQICKALEKSGQTKDP